MAFQSVRRLLTSAHKPAPFNWNWKIKQAYKPPGCYKPSVLLMKNVVASGALMFLGDAIVQNVELYRGQHETGSFDYPRAGRMLAMGLFHGAPRHAFYFWLERRFPAHTAVSTAKKIFFDQAVFSVFIDTTFLFGMSLLEGKGVRASFEFMKDRFPKVFLFDNLFWPPIQIINFVLVPFKYRVLYVSLTNTAWSIVLSACQHAQAW
jgi:protein Mpv17